MSDRQYDLVLFGATGFTGGLTAEYLASNAPEGLRWAIAGRSKPKLEAVRARLTAIDPRLAELPLIEADVEDGASVTALAESTKVIATTVGPYALYGEGLVAACAEAGTDYADLCGEPEFVDRVWLKFDAAARESGARLVHCCGFDSIPHDLGAYYTVLQLPEGEPLRVEGFVKSGGKFSGGTYFSALTGFSRARQTLRAAKLRRENEQRPADRKIGGWVRGLRRNEFAGGWVAPLPTIDPQIVLRSAAANERYGPDFRYGHYLTARHLLTIGVLVVVVGVAFVLAQIPPLRRLMMRAQSPGTGPSESTRAKSWFRVRFVGEGGGKRVTTEVSGGDPGYSETAKMLSESAIALANTADGSVGGQMTPVQAIGDALLERLPATGIAVRVCD